MRTITYEDNANEYNSYVKYEELDTLKEELPNDIFINFNTLQPIKKNMYLRLASKEIDRKFNFKGCKANITNYLSFPRIQLDNPDDNNIIPKNVKIATFIQAIKIYENINNKNNDNSDDNIKRERIGRTIETEYKSFEDKNIVEDINKSDTIFDWLIKLYLNRYISLCINVCRG